MRTSFCCMAVAALLVPTLGQAQSVAGAQYWNCRSTDVARADEIIRDVFLPVFETHIQAGHLTAVNVLGHNIGGGWDRAFAVIAEDVDTFLDGRDMVLADLNNNHADAVQEFQSICGNHQDYIWANVTGSQAQGVSNDVETTVGVTQYFRCDQTREGFADTLTEEVFGPIMNEFVESGDLSSWGWSAHRLGGDYRRILTLRGADAKAVLAAWAGIVAARNEQAAQPSREFGTICTGHVDYLWNVMEAR